MRLPSTLALPVAAALLCLAGCETVPVPQLPTVAPAAWQQPTGHGGAAAPALADWWTAFNDPLLNQLVTRALAENLTLAQARSRVRQARTLAGRDNKQFLPATAIGLRPVQNVPATDAFFQGTLDATWELGLFGAREALDRSAGARVEAAEASRHAASVTLVGEVVRSYVDLRSAQQQVVALQRLAELDRRAIELTDVRVRTHLAAASERDAAKGRLAQTLGQQVQPKQLAVSAAQGLATLLGRTAPDPAWLQPGPQPRLADFSVTQVPADLLRWRPEIRLAEADVFKASGELGSARAELYPRVAIGASLVYSYNVTQNRPLSDHSTPVFGPSIDIPLFDWGRRRAVAGARQEALDASLLAYRQAVIEGVAETEIALATLDLQREREQQVLAGNEALLQRAQAQATLRRLGLASDVDRVADERAATTASLELVTARAARALAAVALFKALGGAPLPTEATAAVALTPTHQLAGAAR